MQSVGPGDEQAVGRVLGTADATPLQFWTAVAPGSYLQLDDVVVTRRELPDREPVTIAGVVTQVRARHEGAQLRLRRVRHRRRHAARPGAGGGRDHRHPGRPRGLRAAAARARWCTGRPARRATRRCTSTGWNGGSRWAPAATACRSSSTPTSSTAPAARTCRSPASPAWPPRPASPRSCSTRCSAPACSAATRSTPRRSSSTSRARTCSSSTTPTPGSTSRTRAAYTQLGPAGRRRSRTCGSTPRRAPATRPARPT